MKLSYLLGPHQFLHAQPHDEQQEQQQQRQNDDAFHVRISSGAQEKARSGERALPTIAEAHYFLA